MTACTGILTRKFLHAHWTGWSLNGRHFLPCLDSMVFSWGIISYQLVCWTGESSHTFLWRGVGSFSVVSAPLLIGIGISTGAVPAAAEVFGMSSCSPFSFLTILLAVSCSFLLFLHFLFSSWVSEALFSLAFLDLLSCLFLSQSQRRSQLQPFRYFPFLLHSPLSSFQNFSNSIHPRMCVCVSNMRMREIAVFARTRTVRLRAFGVKTYI